MFGLFAPRPPLEVREQAWVERHLNVLVDRLGPDRMGLGGGREVAQLLPSECLRGFEPTDEGVLRLTRRFAEHAGVDANDLRVEWFEDSPSKLVERSRSTLGTWSRDGGGAVVGLNVDLKKSPAALAATVAHELCHEVLLGQSGGNHAGEDEEPLTDLAAAALGFGLVVGNQTVSESTTPDGFGWSVGKRGYLTSREIGYALALLWHVRGAAGEPPWVGELRGDAAGAVIGGLKYLRKVGESRFDADTARRPGRRTWDQTRVDLTHRRPARRLAATWDAKGLFTEESLTLEEARRTLPVLLDATRDRDAAVRAGACDSVAAVRPGRRDAADAWERCLLALLTAADDQTAAVRAAALRALAALPDPPNNGAEREEVDRVVLDGLGSRTPAVRRAAAAAAAALPPLADPAGPPPPFAPAVLKALTGALIRCEEAEVAELAATLHRLTPKPVVLAVDRVADEELRDRVLTALREALAVGPTRRSPSPTRRGR